MAVNYNTATKTARLNAVATAIDAGPAAGTLEIGSAGFAAVLAVITLNDPCGTAAADVLTFAGFPKIGNVTTTGTAAAARVKDSTGTVVVSGLTVGTAASDIVLTSVALTASQTVTLNAATITHSA